MSNHAKIINMNREEQIKYIEENLPFSSGMHSKRRVRQDFFSSIDTELQAYLLGFYASDGSINEKRKTFRIHLQEQDSDIVYLFKDMICPDARTFELKDRICVNPRNGKEYKGCNSFGVDINSSKICNDLVNLGFGYNKTYSENSLPPIKKDLIRHFIRGYFDGDGTISGAYVKPDPKWKKNENFRSYVSICCKTRKLLDEIQAFFLENGIKSTICIDRRDQMYCLSVAKLKLPKLFKLFYDDSHFYLKRKYEKFNHFVNTEVTQLIAEYRNAQKVSVSDSNNPSKSVEHPTRMNMCAELTGNCENSEIKSSEDNIIEGSQKF